MNNPKIEAKCVKCGHSGNLSIDEMAVEGIWKNAMDAKDAIIRKMEEALKATLVSEQHYDSCAKCQDLGWDNCGVGSDLAENVWRLREEAFEFYQKAKEGRGDE